LYESFGTDKFDDLYCGYEADESISRTTIGAQELILDLLKERAETGRIYIMNIDHCNSHSSFKDKIEMSNLCQEITLPTYPISHIDDHLGEIALCILSAINVGKVRSDDELEELCELSVRGLEELIDYQRYPVKAAELATKARRSLGVGFIGLAHYLAKLGYKYDSQEAWDAVHGLSESFQYYLLKASNKIAEEKGHCENFGRTKYSDGILPIDTYKKDVDEICSQPLQHDWESLRASILEHGLRHSTLSAQMPSESSSVVCNATNGIEPPRDYLSVKKSKKGPLKQIVPQYGTLKNNYTLLWEQPNNTGYINVVAVMQKFFDQAISGNWSYNPVNYEGSEVPTSVMANDFLTTYKYGWKTSYYQNTHDQKTDDVLEVSNADDVGIQGKTRLDNLLEELENSSEEECESCAI
jgi:ribonucleoside-diphosphate reductase alpha chain